MASHGLHRLLEHLRRALPSSDASHSDGELLARFAARRDEEAFALLVRRHGRMVLGVCRRILGDAHDAEDAFQAAFLVLARKAAALTNGSAVGNWLYGVAYRTALAARSVKARRRARECQVEVLPHPAVGPPEADDWRPLLDRELSRLPDKYREAVVLCELQGLTRQEAARMLQVPAGTVSSRLAAARRLLAQRLARRGVAVSVGAVAWAGAADAAVPAALAVWTAEAATAFAAGQAALAPRVAALTQGVLQAMFLSKLQGVAATLLLAASLAVGCLAFQAAGPGKAAAAQARDDGKDLEALRKENELLKVNLQATLEKIQRLEAEVRDLRARLARGTEKAGPFEAGWDKAIDPDKDCKFVHEKDALTIVVPGKDHDLGVERDKMNAPRLLRDVEGDFVAEVRVGGDSFKPSADSTTTERKSFVGAGLVLMDGDKTYIRLERAGLHRDGELHTYPNWELRKDGEWKLAGGAFGLPFEYKDTYLRLERKGDQVLGSYSQDGKEWTSLDPLEVTLPARLKVGIAAVSTSAEPFKPRFDAFKLTVSGDKKKN
jgi:RNA polymerase sigma factor (sigma-70 family)